LYVSILCCELKKKTLLTTASITHKRRVWRYQRKVIRICKSKKNRQHNGQKKRDLTNNDLNKPIKTKIIYLLFKYFVYISITSLWYLLTIVLSVLLWFTDSDYLPLVSFDHCVVCSSLIYRFWLPPFGIFKLFLCELCPIFAY
jgi:hypothetical protein